MDEKPERMLSISYRKWAVIPVALLVFSVSYLAYVMSTTGLNLDIDLKGGTEINIESDQQVTASALETALAGHDANVRVGRGLTSWTVLISVPIEANATAVMSDLKGAGYSFADYSVQSVGPSLGSSFLQQAMTAFVFAFIAMAVTVFIIFRIPMPSFYVIACGFADILEALAFSQILGIKLSLASFAALLLLLGYSVDTDILLTTRLLKAGAGGDMKKETSRAMKTGFTMTLTTTATLAALYVLQVSPVISQITAVLLLGLVFDVMNTWITNAGLLNWYLRRRAA